MKLLIGQYTICPLLVYKWCIIFTGIRADSYLLGLHLWEIQKMSAPPGMNEGHVTTRPSLFNGYYRWWKAMIEKSLTVEDYELWNIIPDGPNIPIKLDAWVREVPKEWSEFNDIDRKLMGQNSNAKWLFVAWRDENDRVSACADAKEI